MTEPLHAYLSLNGGDWQSKPFIGLDWLMRRSHSPDTRDTRGWLAATVPGSVAHDAWQAGELPDPYTGCNTLAGEWTAQRTWVYHKRFSVPESLRGRRALLRFEGVDYEAQFFLNGERLGAHRGIYTPALFDVTEHLRVGAENLLAVVIDPAPDEQPQVGRTSLVRTHKSRMTYWWDFCPRLVHLGIWDSVHLDFTGPQRIADVWVRSTLDDDFQRAEVAVQVTLDGSAPGEVAVTLACAGAAIAQERASAGSGVTTARFTLDHPALWWPNGHGDQPLYEARVTVIDPASGAESDAQAVTFGIRRVEFVPNDTPDATARPYTAQVNGRKLYLKGWNWVPLDLFYGVERPDKLDHLLGLAQRAHVNILRVWGGGLIEKEAFYDRCDRLGIMVWQEFILSSSGIDNRPSEDPEYVTMLADEARQIIPRKRNHPSLAIWGGGNELADGPKPLDDDHPALAALRGVVEALDPGRMWLPTSPSGRVFSNQLAEIERDPMGQHDVHGPWEHQGLTAQQTLYNRATSLLHSEFGAEGITHRRTLEHTIAAADRWPVTLDNPVWMHRGAWWVKAEQWRESLGEVETLDGLIRGTQFLQAESVRYAVESNRRRKYQNSGSLPWQFNEPYPMAACTSAVDYYGRPKPLYFVVARAYAPLLVAARFETQTWAGRDDFEAVLWGANSTRDATEATLRARLVGLSGAVYAEQEQPLTLRPNAITPGPVVRHALDGVEDVFLLDLALHTGGNEVVSRRTLFTRQPDLGAALHAPEADTQFAVERDDATDTWRVTASNSGPTVALWVWLEDARSPDAPGYAQFDDNFFCLLPGEVRTVTVTWRGAPQTERAIAASGWNVAERVIGPE